jgi:uncharacterized membrane protein YheB (UPF0754 family)
MEVFHSLETSQWLVLGFMPVLSGLIGWFTNYVAVKMLLKPIHPISILGMRFQGLLPRRHHELAKRVSEAIAKDFLTEENILEWVRKADLEQSLKTYIIKKWNEKIGDILSVVPMVQMFVKGEQLNSIRDKVAETFSVNAEEFLQQLADSIAGKIDIKDTIERNILAFDLQQLERIIEDIARKEFRYIERLGGVLGFLIGSVQALLIAFIF